MLDFNLTLGDLMGTIEQFFTKIGLTGCRFKPAYNPYTEPSMEIFSFHPQVRSRHGLSSVPTTADARLRLFTAHSSRSGSRSATPACSARR